MDTTQSLLQLSIFILAGVVAAFVAVRLHMPSIVGYLVAGVFVGLAVPNVLHSGFTTDIAQLGAALLLFTIGIEFSLPSVRRVIKVVLPGSIVQAVMIIAISLAIMPLLKFTDYQALFIGILVSTSSTAFVVKMLEMRDEMHTKAGRIMLGWLVMQDVLMVVWFLVLETYAPGQEANSDILIALVKAALVIGVAFGAGKYLLPALMQQISRVKSDELLIVSVIGVIALFAVFASLLDISYTIGAFLAGLALSESFLNHEIFTETKPIRNLCMMVFFVSVGSLVDLNALANNILPVLVILFVILTLKVIIIVGINVWFNVHIKDAIKVGLGISQISEFAFLAAQLGVTAHWIDSSIYTILVASTVISMTMTPLLYGNSNWVYKFLGRKLQQSLPNLYRGLFLSQAIDEAEEAQMADHIVVCGYGRVGRYIAHALQQANIPFVILELDSANADLAKQENLPVIYGDAANPEILIKAGLETAKGLVVALPQASDTNLIVQKAKELNEELRVIVRSHKVDENWDLEFIDHIVEPEYEAAVQIVSKLFRMLHRRDKRAVQVVQQMHKEGN